MSVLYKKNRVNFSLKIFLATSLTILTLIIGKNLSLKKNFFNSLLLLINDKINEFAEKFASVRIVTPSTVLAASSFGNAACARSARHRCRLLRAIIFFDVMGVIISRKICK